MTDIRKIEAIASNLNDRVKAFHGGDWVTVMLQGGQWVVANGIGSIRIRCAAFDIFDALADFETQLRAREGHDKRLAQTLGLEAAE
jgi:hypothetical protein